MAIRNFIQQGMCYGSANASIVVTLGGQQVYSGPTPTTIEPPPHQPGSDIDTIAVEWTLPADFSGAVPITIQVTGATMILAETMADRSDYANTAAYTGSIYTQTVGDIQVGDPFTSVTIDGVARTRDGSFSGQWYWTIPAGQTFTANLNVTAGITTPDWAADQSYPAHSNVVYQNLVWSNGTQPSPAGTVPSDNPQIWFNIPPPAWDITNNYTIWSRVNSNNMLYTAIQNVAAGTDITNTQYWQYEHS